jgi:hypothetical protein
MALAFKAIAYNYLTKHEYTGLEAMLDLKGLLSDNFASM